MDEQNTLTSHARRPSGRDAKRAARAARAGASIPYITRKIPYYEVLSEEGLALMERNADAILEEIGIDFRDDPEALEIWKAAGADVKGERVHFARGMCRSLIQRTAPREFTQHARNPARSVVIGGKHTVFAPAYGSPFIRNLDEGRRYARIEDFRNFVKLAYLANSLHHSGGTICEPVDLPVNKRHLDMVNSPMTYDATMLGAAKVYARANQALIITPFILAGAMSPVTVAGTVAQTLAEALAGLAFVQLVNPGSPVVLGSFASSISMQSGAPTFGTPEPTLVLYSMAALARRLGIPFRSGGSLCASKIPDAQAAYESANTLVPTCLAGVNFVLHTAGWLEGGLAMGYEKFVMDADQAGMMHTLLAGVDLSENGQALDAMREVGPGKHFLGCAHTQATFENAFYRSLLADNNSYEQWEAEGSPDMTKRANALWKKQLAEYVAPPMDPAIDEALQDYMARRKAASPDSNV